MGIGSRFAGCAQNVVDTFRDSQLLNALQSAASGRHRF
jgi:hypothetical protein